MKLLHKASARSVNQPQEDQCATYVYVKAQCILEFRFDEADTRNSSEIKDAKLECENKNLINHAINLA